MYLGVPNILSTELWDKISIIAAKELPTSRPLIYSYFGWFILSNVAPTDVVLVLIHLKCCTDVIALLCCVICAT